MIRVDCEQGSWEWHEARRGVVTASRFHKIITPTGKLSAQSADLRYRLLAEWLSGETEEEFTTYAMSRGFMMEPEAAAFYEMTANVALDRVGFCYIDDRRLVGCSPDALVGTDGGLEIKCPGGTAHMKCLLTGEVPTEHKPQIQGCLWVTDRKWWDFLSYHPGLPSNIIRVERDEAYISTVRDSVQQFVDQLTADRATLAERGYEPVELMTK